MRSQSITTSTEVGAILNGGKVMSDVSKIKTGDLILMSSDTATANIIRSFGTSEWSHVGIAVWVDVKRGLTIDPDVRTDETILCVFHSDWSYCFDLLTMTYRNGVCLLPLSNTSYKKHAYRSLNAQVDTSRLIAFIEKYRGRDYKSNKVTLAMAAFGWSLALDDETVFCSELVGLYLMDQGLLPPRFIVENPPASLLPDDFSSSKKKVPTALFASNEVLFYAYPSGVAMQVVIPLLVILVLFLLIRLIWSSSK